MGAPLSVRRCVVAKSLMTMGLLPALVFVCSCRLVRKGDDGDGAGASGELQADPFGADRMDSFDNAAEAILASRPMAISR